MRASAKNKVVIHELLTVCGFHDLCINMGAMYEQRAILHVDMDAFFASIEQRDQPELIGKPVLVGGKGPRAVVAAASYEARKFGCRSAQPMSIALRKCPDAVIVSPKMSRYSEISKQIFNILDDFSPLVEPLSIDEAFVDVTGSLRILGSPRQIAEKIRKRILEDTALTASVGVAPNKFLAKLASDMDKPDGLTIIECEGIPQAIAGLAISKMWGVGPVTEKKLQSMGVKTFGDLQGLSVDELTKHFSSQGMKLHHLSHGDDSRLVSPEHSVKSISQEQTFDVDVNDVQAVRDVLLKQVEKVSVRLRKAQLKARTITIKIRYGNFQTITRSITLDEPCAQTDRLWRESRKLFDNWAKDSFKPVRLIGMGASLPTDQGVVAEQLGLFSKPADDRSNKLDEATDAIRNKFGLNAIHRGSS